MFPVVLHCSSLFVHTYANKQNINLYSLSFILKHIFLYTDFYKKLKSGAGWQFSKFSGHFAIKSFLYVS